MYPEDHLKPLSKNKDKKSESLKRGKKAITNKEDRWIESNGTRKRQKDLAKRRNYRGEDWATIVARAFYNKEQSRTYLRIHLINIKQMFN